jgi:hypothetical protein
MIPKAIIGKSHKRYSSNIPIAVEYGKDTGQYSYRQKSDILSDVHWARKARRMRLIKWAKSCYSYISKD